MIAVHEPGEARAEWGLSAPSASEIELASSAQSGQSAQRDRRRDELTSRELRRETVLQTSLYASFITVSTQLGIDIDHFIDEQTSIGLSGNLKMTVMMDYEATSKNYAIHVKRFIGNSFYVKPSIGIHTFQIASRDETLGSSGVGAQLEVGNEWLVTESFGVGVSYGAIGFMYDGEAEKLRMTNLIPSIQLSGAF